MKVCGICGVEASDLEEITVDNENKYVCNDCINKINVCDYCGDYATEVTNVIIRGHDRFVCNNCKEHLNIIECPDCGYLFPRDETTLTNCERVCESCLENYGFCSNCNEYWLFSDMFNDNCCNECIIDCGHDDDTYPGQWIELREEEEADNTPIFGVELEVGFDGGFCENDMMLYDWVSYTRDSSIGYINNMEFLIHPMSWKWINNNRDRLIRLLDKIICCGGEVDDSCGIHIHINRSAFLDFGHLYRFFHLIHGNEEYFFEHSGREDRDTMEKWAEFRPSHTIICRNEPELRNISKYSAVNYKHKATVEIRIFGATLKFDRYIEYISLMNDVFNYTESVDTEDCCINGLIEYRAKKVPLKQLSLT
jgi:hypothetical protein